MLFYCVLVVVLSLRISAEQTFHIGLKGKHANLDRYEANCGAKKDLKIVFDTHSVRFEKNMLYVNQTITVTENIPTNDLMMNIRITRCKSKENPDTCEDFYKQTFKNYCAFLVSSNPFWKPYYDAIEPKFACPLKKGVYKGTNGTIQAATFLMRPATGYFWKVHVQIYENAEGDDEPKLISCTIAEAQVGVSKK